MGPASGLPTPSRRVLLPPPRWARVRPERGLPDPLSRLPTGRGRQGPARSSPPSSLPAPAPGSRLPVPLGLCARSVRPARELTPRDPAQMPSLPRKSSPTLLRARSVSPLGFCSPGARPVTLLRALVGALCFAFSTSMSRGPARDDDNNNPHLPNSHNMSRAT